MGELEKAHMVPEDILARVAADRGRGALCGRHRKCGVAEHIHRVRGARIVQVGEPQRRRRRLRLRIQQAARAHAQGSGFRAGLVKPNAGAAGCVCASSRLRVHMLRVQGLC